MYSYHVILKYLPLFSRESHILLGRPDSRFRMGPPGGGGSSLPNYTYLFGYLRFAYLTLSPSGSGRCSLWRNERKLPPPGEGVLDG